MAAHVASTWLPVLANHNVKLHNFTLAERSVLGFRRIVIEFRREDKYIIFGVIAGDEPEARLYSADSSNYPVGDDLVDFIISGVRGGIMGSHTAGTWLSVLSDDNIKLDNFAFAD